MIPDTTAAASVRSGIAIVLGNGWS
jgi:hypothetical protein